MSCTEFVRLVRLVQMNNVKPLEAEAVTCAFDRKVDAGPDHREDAGN